ncbi:MAG: hypothetical protein LBR28_05410 [Bacteroidales bacterium]|jgi:hypothetical protein|nr:hypothetical protein [Bacteroidales bacterium]
MKNIQKTLLTLALVLFTNLCFAPPAPPTSGDNTTPQQSVDKPKTTTTPVGTATLFVLTMAGGYTAYSTLRRSKKSKEN